MTKYTYDPLLAWVMTALRKGWTPERIEGRLVVEFPDDPRMRVSHECLYQWIYAKPQRILDLRQYLPRGKRRRTRANNHIHIRTACFIPPIFNILPNRTLKQITFLRYISNHIPQLH